MQQTIWFDMDGTFVNLYGVDNWLNCLQNYDETPYLKATPLLRLNTFARLLNTLQAKKHFNIGIISWLSKDSTTEYDNKVKTAKLRWLATHLKSVSFNEIHIVEYGTPKELFAKTKNDILFDDEIQNRKNWTGKAFNEKNIIDTLKTFL